MSGVAFSVTEDQAPLPELLARVEEACGHDAAMAFASRFGGRELYIPRADSIGEDHAIAQTLGLACARNLAQALGHGPLIVPLGPTAGWMRRRASIRRLKAEGVKNSAIAGALGIHLRTVERHVSPGAVTEPEQPTLFDD